MGFVVQENNYVPRSRVAALPIPASYSIPINGRYYYSTVEIKSAGEHFTFTSPSTARWIIC